MIVSLEIIVAAGLVIAGVVIATMAWLWKRFKPAAVSQATTPPPCRISLVPEENPSWKGERQVARLTELFRTVGFQRLGAYRIPELDSQYVLALIHPTEKFYACIYDSKTHPVFEVFAEFGSDNSLMATNSTWVRDIEQRPGSVTLRLSNATPKEIIEALRQHEKAGDRVALTGNGFVAAFIKAYVHNLNWRLKKGDVTRDQIRLDARREGRALTNEQVEELYRARRAAYVAQLQDACRTQYRDEHKIDAAEWQRLQNRVVAVAETFELKEVVNAVSYAAPFALNEQQLHALQRLETSLGDDGIVLIEKIISKNIGGLGLKQLGQVTEPVRAWIVAAPESVPAAADDTASDPVPMTEKIAA